MRLTLILLVTFMFGIYPALAEKSGGVSSSSGNHPRSTVRRPIQNQPGNFNNQHHGYNGSGSNLTYNNGQQWYIDLYSNRNGFYTDVNKRDHYRYDHDRDKYFYNNPNFYYPPYGYTYYYDTGYDRSYYDDRYTDDNGYRVQEPYREKPPQQYQVNPPAYDDPGTMNPENIQTEYYNTADVNDVEADTVIYRWTDGDGNDHYTNDKKKVPDEFLDTLVEMESW